MCEECERIKEELEQDMKDIDDRVHTMMEWFGEGHLKEMAKSERHSLSCMISEFISENLALSVALLTLDKERVVLKIAQTALLLGYKRGYETCKLEYTLAGYPADVK